MFGLCTGVQKGKKVFNLFKKKPKGTLVELAIDGMHCTSCSMNVDGELENLDGVYFAHTSYAKQKTVIDYDPTKTNLNAIKRVIIDLGYTLK